jgi:hypothetical protein
MMDEQPKEMMLCKLDCLLMPNGEILCGRPGRVGWFKDLKKYLDPYAYAAGERTEEYQWTSEKEIASKAWAAATNLLMTLPEGKTIDLTFDFERWWNDFKPIEKPKN